MRTINGPDKGRDDKDVDRRYPRAVPRLQVRRTNLPIVARENPARRVAGYLVPVYSIVLERVPTLNQSKERVMKKAPAKKATRKKATKKKATKKAAKKAPKRKKKATRKATAKKATRKKAAPKRRKKATKKA